MADTRTTDLATMTAVAAGDWFVAVDVSDTSMAASGTTKKLSPAAALAGLSPLTTKGDLLGYGTANDRLPVGTDGQVLTADSTQALGVKWGASSPLTAKGDLLGYSTVNARLPVGSNGQVIVADSTEALGMKWAAVPAPDSTTIGALPAASALQAADEFIVDQDGVTKRATGTQLIALVGGGGGGSPGGTSGQVQLNDGAGGFAGAAGLLIGSVGQPNLAPVTNSTPSAGDMWLPAAGAGFSFTRKVDGSSNRLTVAHGGAIFSCGSCTAVSNNTSLSSLFSSPTNTTGSRTIPAGALRVGNVIEILPIAKYSSPGSATTIAFAVLLGGTTVATTIQAGTVAASTTNGLLNANCPIKILVTAVGASGAVAVFGQFQTVPPSASGVSNVWFGSFSGGVMATITLDTTAALTIDLQSQWGITGGSIQILGCLIDIRN